MYNENFGGDFAATGLNASVLSALSYSGIKTPTAIQSKSIPIVLEGTDVIGVAQTGTGKTLAFALPIIQKILKTDESALILVPTRELALQVRESIEMVTKRLKPEIKVACLIGGTSFYNQVSALKRYPRIVVATPGRLRDHIESRTINITAFKNLVLDEADRMLDMGFLPDIKKILSLLPNKRQTLLYSATFGNELNNIIRSYMQTPKRIEVSPSGTTANKIKQELCYVSATQKTSMLIKFLEQHRGPVLVFSRTKFGAKKLTSLLRKENFKVNEIHSDRTLSQRRSALEGFKAGIYQVLVATDIAARGIDVSSIELVLNYDLPDAAEDYVHRIGRTGRAGQEGKAISLATHEQYNLVRQIERLINIKIPLSDVSEKPAAPKTRSFGNHRRRFRH